MHIRLGIDELAHHLAQIAVVFRDQNPNRFLFHDGPWYASTVPDYESSKASSSAVFSCMRAGLPRDSTLSRTRRSVFEPRRLNRHPGNSRDRPWGKSMLRALLSYRPGTGARLAV